MNNEERKNSYILLKDKIMNIRNEVDTLNASYNELTDLLNRGLRIDNNILNFNDWKSIGTNQKNVVNDLNGTIIPLIDQNINN